MGKKKTPSFTKMVCEALTTADYEKGMNSKMILNFIKEKYLINGDDKSNLNLIHKELELGKTSAEYIQIQGKNIQHGHFSFNLSYVPPNEPQSDQLPDYLNPPESSEAPKAPIEMAKKEKKTKTLAEYVKDLSGSSIKCRLALIYLNEEFLESTSQYQKAVELDVIPKLAKCISKNDPECINSAISCLLLLCEEDPHNCKLALNADIGLKLGGLMPKFDLFANSSLLTLVASKLSSLLQFIIDYAERNNLEIEPKNEIFFLIGIWQIVWDLDEFSIKKLAKPLYYMITSGQDNYNNCFDFEKLANMMHTLVAGSEGVDLIFSSIIFIRISPFEIPFMLQSGLANKLFKLLETTENTDYVKLILQSLYIFTVLFKDDFCAKCDNENVKILYPLIRSDDKDIFMQAGFIFQIFISKFEKDNDISSTESLIFPAFEKYAESCYKLFGTNVYKSKTGVMFEICRSTDSTTDLEKRFAAINV